MGSGNGNGYDVRPRELVAEASGLDGVATDTTGAAGRGAAALGRAIGACAGGSLAAALSRFQEQLAAQSEGLVADVRDTGSGLRGSAAFYVLDDLLAGKDIAGVTIPGLS